MDPIILTLSVGFLTVILYLWSQRKPKNFPPGPWGFPILGHLPLLGLEPHKTAIAWKPKYGPIVGIDFASFPCVIISDYKLAKEALALASFSGRPKLPFLALRSGGRPEGIIMSEGRTWREQRTFSHRRLKELGGFGTRSMETQIVAEVQDFVAELRVTSQNGRQPICTRHLFNLPVLSALWVIIAGEPLSRQDDSVKHVLHVTLEAIADNNIFTMLSMFMPWFANNFPYWLTRADEMHKMLLTATEFVKPCIDEHYKTHLPGQPRDFIDSYIDEVNATTDPESSFHKSRSKNALETAVTDFFLGGADTTGITMEWICLIMAKFPETQERMAAEIEVTIGFTRPPSLQDRKSLPYTEAVINEVVRYRPVIALGLFHATTEDVCFHGYKIPKDTMIFTNAWDAHFDQKLWGEDAGEFRPQRWLNEDGTEVVRRDGILLFSSGKRACPGE